MNIVSFYAPRPEHPFFQDYRPFLALLRESCVRFGHDHLVLTDDPMEVGSEDAYVVDLPRSLMKALIAAQHAYLADPAMADEPTLLTGADCVLARDPAWMAEHDADIVITVGDFADCRMNCGAIYIRRPAVLAPVWETALAHVGDDWGDDQTSLYLAIQQAGVRGLKIVELPVDPYNLAPEHPDDDCTRGVVLHFRGPRKRWMVDYCHKWLDLGEGCSLRVVPNATDEQVDANVVINAARGLPVVRKRLAHDGHAVLVGGGPSLASCLVEIRWRQEQGQTIFALNGAARWLQERGIEPDYGVILDPRPGNAAFVVPGPNWLIASQCDPAVFDAAGDRAVIWHFGSEEESPPLPPGTVDLVGGGLTVGLTAMGLAFVMGFRKLHLYGYDSSDADDRSHAYAQDETAAEEKRVEVWCGSRCFTASPGMYAQAKAFEGWANTLTAAGVLMTVNGDGLLPEIARHMHAAIQIQEQVA